MPIRSLGLLQARVPIYVSARSCKPAKPRSTPSANSFFTDRSCNSSPLLINTPHDHLHLNQLPNHETAFNIHTSQADHRDRGKRLRLPSCLLIETASNDAPALPVAPCSRRFRCRLATNRTNRTLLIGNRPVADPYPEQGATDPQAVCSTQCGLRFRWYARCGPFRSSLPPG